MADKKAKPARSTYYSGSGGTSPAVNAGEQLGYSWSLGGGDTIDPQPNPSGATPIPFAMSDGMGMTPPNANPAAMRGYTRNAPYMEGLVSDPQAMHNEMINLKRALAENPGDVVSEYRLRVLMQAMRDIYNTQPLGGTPTLPLGSTLPVTPGSK